VVAGTIDEDITEVGDSYPCTQYQRGFERERGSSRVKTIVPGERKRDKRKKMEEIKEKEIEDEQRF